MTSMRMASLGGAIALVVISFFVFGVDQPKPEWGKFWMIKPLIMTPFAGAISGAFSYFIHLKISRRINTAVSFAISLVIFLLGLWVGIVLGLNGTMWD